MEIKKPEDMTWADIRATLAEAAALSKENEKGLKDLRKSVAETTDAVKETNRLLTGIGLSNGMVAEDYFFESLDKTKTLGGVHYDDVVKNVHSMTRLQDGKRLEGQYDIVMYNDTAVCIVEVKYRLRAGDVQEAVDKDIGVFKTLFPKYADYKFYVAVGGMTIEDRAMNAAKQLGVGVLRLNGDAVEIYDKDLKAY